MHLLTRSDRPPETQVLGRFDVAARTTWSNASRLWVSPEELRVAAGTFLAGDRVLRREAGAQVRLGRRPLGPCVEWRPPGARRWRRLCSYPSSTGAVAPRALARAGWISLADGPWTGPDAFFQSCRRRRLARRGWCIVTADAIRLESPREVAVVPRSSVRSVHVAAGRRATPVHVATGDAPDGRVLCHSFAPGDLRSALTSCGWPLEPAG